jgi:ribosomal protein L14E/L6E/L27E
MKVSTPLIGGVAQSTQGRDKGHFYLIVKVENGFVFVADGTQKTWQSPKRKNEKHLRYLPCTDQKTADTLKQNGILNNCDIAYFLKQFAQNNKLNTAQQAEGK